MRGSPIDPEALDALFADEQEDDMPIATGRTAPLEGDEEEAEMDADDPSDTPLARLDAMQAELDELRAMLA